MLAKIRSLTFPLVVLCVGFGFSMAINVMATQPDPHLVMGGVMASVALPAAIHLWPMVPANNFWTSSVRALVMTALAGMAAYITFRHGASIMMPKAVEGQPLSPWDEATGYLYTLITEALVVLGVMAHRAQQRDRQDAAGRREKATTPPPAEPPVDEVPDDRSDEREVPADDEIPEPSRRRRRLSAVSGGGAVRERVRTAYFELARETLAKGGSLDSIAAAEVDRRAGASIGYAKKHLRDWRVELEAELAAAGEAVS